MIALIRNSFITKSTSVSMIFVMFFTMIAPFNSYGLTGGPAQPEFNSFTPIGTSDMVDLASGDFSYNIPIMDIGGFPVNLAYKSGVTMDQEASWVGLGWDLSVGQINRQMRGLPDDFDGDEMIYENNMKENLTVGASFNFSPYAAGVGSASVSAGVTAQYNSYNGYSLAPSVGLTYEISNNLSVGLSVKSDENGLTVSPNASLSANAGTYEKRDQGVGVSVGVSFNSRQGLSSVNMSASHKSTTGSTLTKDLKTHGSGSIGSSIGFVNNHYTPSVNPDVESNNYTFNAALGSEFFIAEGQGQVGAFASSQAIPEENRIRTELGYGYDNTHKQGVTGVKDFNREKDGNFSINTTNLPLTNYTYDIYSISGQGVSGMFRPYRSQVGYVHDNFASTYSGGGSFGFEFGVGNAAHNGIDFDVTTSEGKNKIWQQANQALASLKSQDSGDPLYEEVYFKNVGDLSVDDESDMYGTSTTKLGGKSPIRIAINGLKFYRQALAKYEIKDPSTPNAFLSSQFASITAPSTSASIKRSQRVKRNQNIQKVRTDEVDLLGTSDLLGFKVNSSAEPHHTAGYIITRNDGARYIYGEALYNKHKKEVTFAIQGEVGDCGNGLVHYNNGVDNTVNNLRGDYYFSSITTPSYAHTYLLTTLLSADYADIDGVDGPSDNDFGSYTSFTYENAANDYKWRVPLEANKANFNEGIKTDPKDDRGSYVYGVKETKYLETIETKTHIAVFETSVRQDGKGVIGENGGIGSSSMKQLNSIALYSKAEYYDANGNAISNPVPIKTAHFDYDYELCGGTGLINSTGNGKLTLKKVYFTYRNSNMGKYSAYQFKYGDINHDGSVIINPNYHLKGYDIWGCYKSTPLNGDCSPSSAITVPEYNYVEQEGSEADENVAAWSLTDIELPSGGEIKVDYESDDYQYVQDKKAMRMFKVVGAGRYGNPTNDPNLPSGGFFNPNSINDALLYGTGPNFSHGDAKYLYIKLPQADNSINDSEFQKKYLQDIIDNQDRLVYFRFMMNMTQDGGLNVTFNNANFDYVTGYFKLHNDIQIFNHNGNAYASVEMQLVNLEGGVGGQLDVNPISKAGGNFGRKFIPSYIYGLPGYNGDLDPNLIVNTILQTFDNIAEIFTGPNGLLRTKKIARRFIPEKSWIRLSNPTKIKKGGGCRVSAIEMTDSWETMTAQEQGGLDPSRGQEYGQEYNYELENGGSSGVATYEPVGSKENPFVQPSFVKENRLLAPDEENFIEKPFGESFFPSPQVTYSRVSVKNLERAENGKVVKKHATGHVVTEFYTSKDYPTKVDQTELKLFEDKNSFLSGLLNLDDKKHYTASQGYVVSLNDMNGKMKSQRVFAEGQTSYISGVDYNYGLHTVSNSQLAPTNQISNNIGYLNNEVWTLSPEGNFEKNTLGVEYDIINDFREKSTVTEVIGINTNLATFLAGIFPGIVPVPLPDYARHEDQLRLVTTTKVINTFGVQQEVIAYDAGAKVSTKNLVWDHQTGEVLLTETVNEYDDKYYSFNYPAHWYYDGMGMAYENSGVTFEVTTSGSSYTPPSSISASDLMFNGDKLICKTASGLVKGWAHDVGSNFNVIDENGVNIPNVVEIKVIQSGRKNLQSTSMGSVVLMKNPFANLMSSNGGTIPNNFLESVNWDDNRIMNAGAVEFSDEWELQCECGVDPANASVNPYLNNKKGIWRANKSLLYLTKRHHTSKRNLSDSNPNNDSPDPRNNGFYTTFKPFYEFVAGDWNKPTNTTNNDWTYTSEVTQFSPYGFELENKDALSRYSAAQYGYNAMFPMAVSANSEYAEMGFDGFEDYGFLGCTDNVHFGYKGLQNIILSSEESHTGRYSLNVAPNTFIGRLYATADRECSISYDCGTFNLKNDKKYWISAWVKVDKANQVKSYAVNTTNNEAHIEMAFTGVTVPSIRFYPTGDIIDGWQRIVGKFEMPMGICGMDLRLRADASDQTYFDDLRIHPFNGSMKSYVYDSETFWLTSELDDNNYATFYEYDNEGGLIRIKKETVRGVVTIQETRSNTIKK